MSTREFTARDGALLGAAAASGWTVLDLILFTSSGSPRYALALLPASLIAIALAGLAGMLVRRPRRLLVLLVASALGLATALLLRHMDGVRVPLRLAWLSRALLLLGLAYGLAGLHRRTHPSGNLLVAAGLGLLAALASFALGPPWLVLMAVTSLLAGSLFLAAFLRRARWRALVLAVAGTALVLFLAPLSRRSLATRGDLPPVRGPRDAPSAVLIVLDTVRADHLQTYGYERETTPGLDAFARDEATLYTDCRSTAPFTLASHASMFTGLLPSEHHAARPGESAEPIRADAPTLAERLRDAGYQTAAIVANRLYLRPSLGMDRGFEHFDDRRSCYVGQHIALGQLLGGDALRLGHIGHREASEITDIALAWLDEERRDQPFFLFLNYLDAHSPYYPPRAFSDLWEDGRQPLDPLRTQGEIRSLLYDRELAYLDAEVTRLLSGLKERGLFEGSLVIVTSDHGDDFLEHDVIEHCWQLYDSLVHVPLYVKPPGGRRRERVEEPLTVAELYRLTQRELGLDPGQRSPDHDVVAEWYPAVPTNQSYARWAERTGFDLDANRVAWIEDGRKWIVSSNGEVELYDLTTDPDELSPLEVDEQQAGVMRRRAALWWDANPLPEPSGEELSEERLAALRALGYG